MKEPPYFKLTEVEPQTALWAGLMFMLIAVMLIAFISQRLSNATGGGVQANAPQRLKLQRALQQTFATENRQAEIGINNTGTHLQLTINPQLLFPPHKTELWPTGKNFLQRLAQTLRSVPGAGYQHIQIEGHTESDGFAAIYYPRDNWELSSGQAVSTLKFLAAATKLDSRLFSAHGYADSRPLPATRTAREKITNQRLEVNIFIGTDKP